LAFIEDDMRLHDGFTDWLEKVPALFGGDPGLNIVRLHQWGEGYVTSLEGAKRIFQMFKERGMVNNIDIQLNYQSGKSLLKYCGYFSRTSKTNEGDCLKTDELDDLFFNAAVRHEWQGLREVAGRIEQEKKPFSMRQGRPVQLEGITSLARDIASPGTIVEIGTYSGEGAVILSGYFFEVVAVDPWSWKDGEELFDGFTGNPDSLADWTPTPPSELIEEAFDKNVEGISNIRKVKAFDFDIVDDFDNDSLDAVYIDSIHTFDSLMATVRRWLTKIRSGGYLAGHDYSDSWKGVVEAVDQISRMLHQQPVVYCDGSWRFTKK
jgi:hypothetical protein